MNILKTKDLWLRGLHIVLALSIPFIIAILISCNRAKEEPGNLGPEFSSDQIDLALSKAINDADLNSLSVGQFTEYVTTQRIENEENINAVAGSRVEVINREETDTAIKFTLKIVRTDRLSNGQWETRVTEEPLAINKPSLLSIDNLMTPDRVTTSALKMAADKAVKKVTFHKLRESTGTMPPPPRVRLKADCGGLNPCEMPVRYISFDMVQWTSDTEYQKLSLDFAFSLSTPFLPFGEDFEQLNGLMVLDCRATYIPIENRNVYIRECKSLDDFKK